MKPPSHRSFLQLLIIATLLFLVFFIRAHEATAMPAFNDESLHIRRSEIVWTFDSPATSFTAGKLLGYYWLGAFGFDRLDALHGGRLVYALFILIGAAATYRVGRSLFNHAVGALALSLYAFAPFLVFYERLILADQLAASFGMLAICAGIRLARHPTRQNGLLSGVSVSLAILAKLTAAPFALVSLAAIWTLGTRDEPPPTGNHWQDRLARRVPRRYWAALGTAYGFNVLSGLPFMLFPIFRQATNEPVLLVGTNLFVTSGFFEVFVENVPRLWQMLTGFFGPVAVLVAPIVVARLLRRARRPAFYLLLCMALPWSIILVFSPDPSNRYWLLGMPPLLVLVAAGLWDVGAGLQPPQDRRGNRPLYRMGRESGRGVKLAPGLVAIWVITLAGPFVWHAWTDPLVLRLPEHDQWEYYTNYSSGYGLDKAIRFMPGLTASDTSGRVPVVGLVVGCHALRLYLPEDGPVDLSCPFFGWEGEYMGEVAQHVERRLEKESVVYLLVEPESPFTDLSAIPVRRELIKRFERPWDGMAVELYQVFVLENDQAEAQRARLLLIREFPQKTPQPFIHLLRGRDAA